MEAKLGPLSLAVLTPFQPHHRTRSVTQHLRTEDFSTNLPEKREPGLRFKVSLSI